MGPADPNITVLCVDDHRIVREGITLIINREPDMRVVASAETGEEAVEAFRRHRPDVTLMDLQLGSMSGVDAIRTIRSENAVARIVALTMYQGDEDIFRAIDAGAAAYLLKDALSDDLIRVVRDVSAGKQPIFSARIKAQLAERASRPTLTPREVQVLELMSVGLRNREIAASLSLSEKTAEVHVKNILSKLDARDRTAAVNIALRRGIVHLK